MIEEAALISEIEIIPVKPQKGLIAFASFILNNQFYVGDIAIYTKPDGSDYRLVYPSKTLANGKQINLFHPINLRAGEKIKNEIVNRYLALIEKHNRNY